MGKLETKANIRLGENLKKNEPHLTDGGPCDMLFDSEISAQGIYSKEILGRVAQDTCQRSRVVCNSKNLVNT